MLSGSSRLHASPLTLLTDGCQESRSVHRRRDAKFSPTRHSTKEKDHDDSGFRSSRSIDARSSDRPQVGGGDGRRTFSLRIDRARCLARAAGSYTHASGGAAGGRRGQRAMSRGRQGVRAGAGEGDGHSSGHAACGVERRPRRLALDFRISAGDERAGDVPRIHRRAVEPMIRISGTFHQVHFRIRANSLRQACSRGSRRSVTERQSKSVSISS
jgi:hypothetical protein